MRIRSAASTLTCARAIGNWTPWFCPIGLPKTTRSLDRKSTRLNSSHGYISYAVFCLKKKKKKKKQIKKKKKKKKKEYKKRRREKRQLSVEKREDVDK